MARTSSFFPLNAKEDVRAATCRPDTLASAVIRSSVNAVAEVLVLPVRAHVHERQHGDRLPGVLCSARTRIATRRSSRPQRGRRPRRPIPDATIFVTAAARSPDGRGAWAAWWPPHPGRRGPPARSETGASGSFSRQRRDDARRAGARATRQAAIGGSSFRMACIVSTAESPLEGPPAGQHLVEHAPKEKMSERWSSGLAADLLGRHVADRADHGARRACPRLVCAASPVAPDPSGPMRLARPKSRILTRPSLVTKMFSGFRSRWTMPLSCAAARPRAIWIAEVDGLADGQRAARRRRSRRVSPSSSSVTA